jgi:hypothetical protein
MAGLVTDEFASTSAALISISDAEQGAVPSGTAIADNVFNSVYRTVRTADDLLAGSKPSRRNSMPGREAAFGHSHSRSRPRRSVRQYSRIRKSRSTPYGVTAPVYVSRAEALALVRALLDSAAATITATPPSAFFNATILTPGVNLTNVIQLFRARYARMANDDATALAAANLVGRSGSAALSLLTFPSPAVNFYANVTGGTNGIAPRRQWRLSMATGRPALQLLRRAVHDSHRANRRAARPLVAIRESAGSASRVHARRGTPHQGRGVGESESAGRRAGRPRLGPYGLYRWARRGRPQRHA